MKTRYYFPIIGEYGCRTEFLSIGWQENTKIYLHPPESLTGWESFLRPFNREEGPHHAIYLKGYLLNIKPFVTELYDKVFSRVPGFKDHILTDKKGVYGILGPSNRKSAPYLHLLLGFVREFVEISCELPPIHTWRTKDFVKALEIAQVCRTAWMLSVPDEYDGDLQRVEIGTSDDAVYNLIVTMSEAFEDPMMSTTELITDVSKPLMVPSDLRPYIVGHRGDITVIDPLFEPAFDSREWFTKDTEYERYSVRGGKIVAVEESRIITGEIVPVENKEIIAISEGATIEH